MRMISKEAKNMIYHRPECRFAKKIKKRNRVQMHWKEAERKGFRTCKCCESMRFLYSIEQIDAENLVKNNNMNIDLVSDELIIRTEIASWRIVYEKSRQNYMLFHHKHKYGRLTLEEAATKSYHRQGDVPYASSIMKYLKYIQAHDEFKAKSVDYRNMPQSTARQRRYYRSAKKQAEKQSARRLDNLFSMIERKEGIKQLSYC